MRRRQFTAMVVALLAVALASARAAEERVSRVGILRLGQLPDPFTTAFLEEMQALGYVEGRNVVYLMRWAEGHPDRGPGLARDLAQSRVDVILTGGDSLVRAAMEAAPTTPIVMGASNDPIGTGLARSLARPGGNVTGLTILSRELSQKRLEMFREAIPKLSRVAVFYNPTFASARADLEATESAALILGLTLRVIVVSQPTAIETAFAELNLRDVDGLITLADPFFTTHRAKIVELARTHGLPTMFYWREFVQAGGLVSYGPDNVALYRRAAHFVDKILKGGKPDELPIEQPMRFVLSLNLGTAKALGVTIPPALLARADEIIE
jgi:putative ABC transport system substrate-binding protein